MLVLRSPVPVLVERRELSALLVLPVWLVLPRGALRSLHPAHVETAQKDTRENPYNLTHYVALINLIEKGRVETNAGLKTL